MKRLPLVLGLVFALVVLVGIGCEKEVIKEITVHDTVTVEIMVQNINVDTVIVDPGSGITPGQTVELIAQVSTEDEVDDSNLKYDWFADAGELVSTSSDTAMWKAADSVGTYTVSVHVSAENQYIGIGSRMLGVGEYVPAADQYYVGVSTCDDCHTSIADGWAETGHAHAWASLQTSDHAASYCEPCHTVDQVDVASNSGYDEVPTVQFEDVQCESCHGPGSEHPSDNPSGTIPLTDASVLEAETCGVCHEGSHHPYYEEWQESAHNFDPAVSAHGAGARSYCGPCHAGTHFVEAYDSEHDGLWAASEDKLGITCGVCHDPHNGENPGLLRSLADVTLVENVYDNDGSSPEVLSGNGAGQLCIQCHHARHVPEGPEGSGEVGISEGDEHLGPHYSAQADVVYGESGMEGVASGMVFASSGHGLIEDACTACHVNAIPYGEFAADSAYVGHTFEPRVEACESCHGEIADFADIDAKKDFDNDGTTEGIQEEVSGLVDLLVDELYTDFAATYVGTDPEITTSDMIDSLANTFEETDAEAVRFRSAGYNLIFAVEDGSMGVHNPAYIIQLLQQSILFLDDTAIPPENVLRTEERLATTFAMQ